MASVAIEIQRTTLFILIFVYLSAFTSGSQKDQWLAWCKNIGNKKLDLQMPNWVLGILTCGIISALSWFFIQQNFIIFTVPFLFILRDLSFFQWYRLTDSKRPEIAATIFIALFYLVPNLIFTVLDLSEWNILTLPIFPQGYKHELFEIQAMDAKAILSVISPMIQMSIAMFLLYLKSSKTLKKSKITD